MMFAIKNISKKTSLTLLSFFTLSLLMSLKHEEPQVLKGVASFYAKKFEGRRTSNGEIFRHDSLTCAHKTLRFGTMLKVTNLSNDSIVFVKVNDRLPKSSKRSIDLTHRAAKQLNFINKGLTKVTMEILKPETLEITNLGLK